MKIKVLIVEDQFIEINNFLNCDIKYLNIRNYQS